jgi:hypothetical protein
VGRLSSLMVENNFSYSPMNSFLLIIKRISGYEYKWMGLNIEFLKIRLLLKQNVNNQIKEFNEIENDKINSN